MGVLWFVLFRVKEQKWGTHLCVKRALVQFGPKSWVWVPWSQLESLLKNISATDAGS